MVLTLFWVKIKKEELMSLINPMMLRLPYFYIPSIEKEPIKWQISNINIFIIILTI